MEFSGVMPIFPTGIYSENIGEITDAEYNFVDSIIYQDKNMPGGNLRSDSIFILNTNQMKRIKDFIQGCLNVYVDRVYGSNQRLHITISWLNKNKPGTGHHMHNHSNSIVSGVFYFRTNTPLTLHRKDKHKIIDLDVKEFNQYNSSTLRLQTSPGDLILFPSHMLHSVEPNADSDERISLAFNTFYKGEVGSSDSLTYVNI